MKPLICGLLILLAFGNQPSEDTGWYSVDFKILCENRAVTPERSVRFGKLTAYRIKQDTLSQDTIRVSFDFMSNCCEVFDTRASITEDTLRLDYFKTNTETCRCLCDYRFTYAVTDTTKTWSGIKIKRIKN